MRPFLHPDPGPRTSLVDFTAPGGTDGWRAVGDAVMGGRSEGALARSDEGTCAFSGRVSLELGGGFASVRSGELGACPPGARALVLTCRGDGKRYKLRLFARGAAEGLAYQAAFRTVPDVWLEHRFEVGDFEPVWRGRSVPDAAPLELASLAGVGLLISDRQAGPFRLELRSLEVCP